MSSQLDSKTRLVDFSKAHLGKSPNPKKMTLKSQLKFYLDQRGMTAAELARKAGVSKQVLSLWLSGAKPKNVDQVRKVAVALGTTIDHLMFGDGEDREKQRVTELDALLGDGWVSGLFEVRFRRVRRTKG